MTRLRAALLLALAAATGLATSLLGPGTALCESPQPAPITVEAQFTPGEPKTPELGSVAALVIDADSGQVLFAKNADKQLPMASTTKMMTAILVLESLDLNTKVMVSRNAHFQRGSLVGLQALEVVTVEQLLYGLLVSSGNDCAVALAEETSGSVNKFVAKMNEKAKAMGLTNTHFTNPDGLQESGHYSSCTDLAAMAREAMKNEIFRKIVKTPLYELPHPTSPTPRELKSSNALLTKFEWVTGVKTGSTPVAGYCMVASGTKNGVSLIVVQLGAKDDATRWIDVEALFDYGFKLCPMTSLARPDQVIVEIPVGDPLDQSLPLVPAGRLATRLRKGEVATGTITLSKQPHLPIQAGEVFGSVEFTLGGKSLGKLDLVAQRGVYIPSIRQIVVHARNWCLPEFQVGALEGRPPE